MAEQSKNANLIFCLGGKTTQGGYAVSSPLFGNGPSSILRFFAFVWLYSTGGKPRNYHEIVLT